MCVVVCVREVISTQNTKKMSRLSLLPTKVSPRITHIYVLPPARPRPFPLKLRHFAPCDISCFCFAATHSTHSTHTHTHSHTQQHTHARRLALSVCFFNFIYCKTGEEMSRVCACPDAGDNPLMSFLCLAASTPPPPPCLCNSSSNTPAWTELSLHLLYLYQQLE